RPRRPAPRPAPTRSARRRTHGPPRATSPAPSEGTRAQEAGTKGIRAPAGEETAAGPPGLAARPRDRPDPGGRADLDVSAALTWPPSLLGRPLTTEEVPR